MLLRLFNVKSVIVICLFSMFAVICQSASFIPASGDFIKYAAVEEAFEDGWSNGQTGGYISVFQYSTENAIRITGSDGYGGLRWLPTNLDLTNFDVTKICFRIRQNVHSVYGFTVHIQFMDSSPAAVVKATPGGAGWSGWEDVEIDLSGEDMGKVYSLAIYSSLFDSETEYLEIDNLHFEVQQQSPQAQTPIMAIPLLSSSPVIDGNITISEWQKSAALKGFVDAGGYLNERDVKVYAGYDSSKLYIAFSSEFASNGMPALGDPGQLTEQDLTADFDFVEIWLKSSTQLYRRFVINMNGGLFEQDIDPCVPSSSSALISSSIQMNSQLTGGIWSVEFAVPFSGLGVSTPYESMSWQALFVRDYAGDSGTERIWADWTSWAYADGGLYDPAYYGNMIFTSQLPVVHLDKIVNGNDRDLTVKGNFISAVSEQINTDIYAVGFDTVDLLDDSNSITFSSPIGAFEVGGYTDNSIITDGLCKISFTHTGYGVLLYRQDFKLTIGSPLWFKAVPLGRNGNLLIDIGTTRIPELTTDGNVNIEVFPVDSQTMILQDSFTYPAEKNRVLHEIDCNSLTHGYYRVECNLTDQQQNILATNVDPNVWIGLPIWGNNQIGISETVPPPWIPVAVNGKDIDILERQYSLADNGMPSAIVSLGKDILATPSTITVTTSSGPQTCSFSQISLLSNTDCNAIYSITGESASLTFNGTVSIEYDGFAVWSMDILAKNSVTIEDISLNFEFPKSRSMYARGKRTEGFVGGYVAAFDIDNTSTPDYIAKTYFSNNSWPWNDKFFHEIFVGDDDSGFSIMTETAEYHSGDTHIVIEDVNTANRKLQIHLTGNCYRTASDEPLHYEYAWVGLPLKTPPSDPNAWHVTIGPVGTVDEHPVDIGAELFERCPIMIGGRYCRYDTHYQIIHPNPTLRYPRRTGEQPADVIGMIQQINQWGCKVTNDGYYMNCADSTAPESLIYMPEWQLVDSPRRYYNFQSAWDIGTCKRSSWEDYCVYAAKKLYENGVNGIYYDDTGITACNNFYQDCGYIDQSGIRRKDMDVLATRKIHKRIYTYYKSLAEPGVTYHHHLDSAAWAGFCDGGFQGEEWSAEKNNPLGMEYQDMTPELFRATTFSQYGTPYTWYAHWGYVGKTSLAEMLAMSLPHKVMPAIWNTRDNHWPDIKPYWIVLDNWWTSSEFSGYWHSTPPATSGSSNVLISGFVKSDSNEVLLIVSNWNYSDVNNLTIYSNPEVIAGSLNHSTLNDAISGQLITGAQPGSFSLDVPARNLRLILIEVDGPLPGDITTNLTAHWKLDGNAADSAGLIDLTPTSYASRPYVPIFIPDNKVEGSHSARVGLGTDMGGFKAYGASVNTALNSPYEMTMSCWFKLDSLPTLAQFFTKWGGSQGNLYQLYYYNSDKRIALYLYNTTGYGQDLKVTNVDIELNQWYHLAALAKTDLPASQDNVWIYLTPQSSESPQLLGSFEWTPADGNRQMNINNNGWFHLCNGEAGFGYSGLMDEARFYKRCLSIYDLQMLYYNVPPRSCEDAIRKGYSLPCDFSQNCYVGWSDLVFLADSWLNDLNMTDFAQCAEQWLNCINPEDANCVHPWQQ